MAGRFMASFSTVSVVRHRFSLPQLLFVLTVAAYFWAVRQSAPHLSERVATHFAWHGEANGWMGRGEYERFLLGFGLGVAGFLVGLLHVARFLLACCLQVPGSDFWRLPQHYPVACRILARWSWLLAAMHLLFLGMVNVSVVAANQLSPPRLAGDALLWPVGIFLTGTGVLVWGLLRSLHRARMDWDVAS